jgi:hypothetical protein
LFCGAVVDTSVNVLTLIPIAFCGSLLVAPCSQYLSQPCNITNWHKQQLACNDQGKFYMGTNKGGWETWTLEPVRGTTVRAVGVRLVVERTWAVSLMTARPTAFRTVSC